MNYKKDILIFIINFIILIISIIIIFHTIINQKNYLNTKLSYINKIKYPYNIPQKNPKNWIKCFCKTYTHFIPCIKLYSYNQLIYNINYNKCSFKLKCCKNNNIFYNLNYSNNTYHKYINKTINCFTNGYKLFINNNNNDDYYLFIISCLFASISSITILSLLVYNLYKPV